MDNTFICIQDCIDNNSSFLYHIIISSDSSLSAHGLDVFFLYIRKSFIL